ncbi:MAG: endo alpha-1,4 polygalactosaminidase [Armatimonadetes bacterium]|nr:endo alpha-1,4 polygalactosaminidase [Anaerolineae bacterium]
MCAFQFKGNADGSSSALSQTIVDTAAITSGTTLSFSAYIDPRSSVIGTTFGKAQIKYSDGTKQKFVLTIPSADDYLLVSDVQTVVIPAGATISKAKVKFTVNQPSGKFLIDDASFAVNPAQHWQPAPGTTWQWQLTEDINTSYDVMMYDIDLFDAPQAVIDTLHADGRIVICYFSAGSYENWRPDAADFPEAVLGDPLDDWPGERWLDISQLELLQPIMLARLELASQKNCDGVEPDNVDGYTNTTGFALTDAHQLAYNTWLATAAHSLGLSIGLKNDLDQIPDLVDVFDWALNEQCFQYNECDTLLPFIEAGKAVFGVEYSEEGGDPADYCPLANAAGFSWLTKTYDLGDTPPNSCLDFP